MCANSHSKTPYVTPKWVFDAGAKHRLLDMKDLPNPYAGRPGKKAVPDAAYHWLLIICGLALVGLGVYFLVSGIDFLAD